MHRLETDDSLFIIRFLYPQKSQNKYVASTAYSIRI